MVTHLPLASCCRTELESTLHHAAVLVSPTPAFMLKASPSRDGELSRSLGLAGVLRGARLQGVLVCVWLSPATPWQASEFLALLFYRGSVQSAPGLTPRLRAM